MRDEADSTESIHRLWDELAGFEPAVIRLSRNVNWIDTVNR